MREEYDQMVEAWRKATRHVLAAGNDNPDATAEDLRGLLEDLITEEAEN